MSSGNTIVTYILLFATIGLCLESWRDCKKTDLPCIQFSKRLCICTLFWDPSKKQQVYKYICENMPHSTPNWVMETWACPIPGIGKPSIEVWRTYLDPLLKGLEKIPHPVKNNSKLGNRVTKRRFYDTTYSILPGRQ